MQCPCHSMRILNDHLQKHTTQSSSPQVAAWMINYRNWPKEDFSEEKPLEVHFMNECPEEWKYQGKSIDADFIMEILQSSWRDCFKTSESNEANIRVRFKGR